MNKNYELNLVIDTNLSSVQIAEVKAKCEKIIWKESIVKIDDIWLLNVAYPIRWQNQAYYVSYYLKLSPTLIPGIESELRINKWIVKFFTYSMSDSDVFETFSNVQKKVLEVFPLQEEVTEEEEIEDKEIALDASSKE